jgi:integrase
MPRPKRPHIAKRRIRGSVRYVVDLGIIDGKRYERFFPTREKAQQHLDEQKRALGRHGESAVALSEQDRILFQAARDQLATAAVTINEAVAYFLANHKAVKEAISLQTLIDRCVLDKELGGARKRYLQTFGCSCRAFAKGREERLAHTVTRDEVRAWILGNKYAPKTQRNYLGDLRECFEWGMRAGHLTKNPIGGDDGYIQLAADDEGEITALDLADCTALLRTAMLGTAETHGRAGTGRWTPISQPYGFRPLMGYLVIAMFAGVRPEEIKRTPLVKLNARERTVVIMGKSAKTRQRRVIELRRTAAVWLRLWLRLCPGIETLTPKNFDRRWKALRKAAGVRDWPHDALRHTFASYHYAAFQNTALLQAQMGHSEREDTLFRHYRAVQTVTGATVNKKGGEAFWALTPRRVRVK